MHEGDAHPRSVRCGHWDRASWLVSWLLLLVCSDSHRLFKSGRYRNVIATVYVLYKVVLVQPGATIGFRSHLVPYGVGFDLAPLKSRGEATSGREGLLLLVS